MSGEMSQALADAYGTLSGHQSQEEVEKVAAAQFIEKMASRDGIDLNSLTDEQVQTVATHYLTELQKEAAPEALAEQPVAAEMGDEEKRAAAEMAEADFLGRMMAHSFVQELDGIQKQAAAAAPAEQPEVPEVLLKLAEARALQFLQEKVAVGELCRCGDAACDGRSCKADEGGSEKEASPAEQAEYVDALAAQMLDQAGYGKFLQ